MTRLLEKAFAEAARLPETEQNALARWLLEEIEADRKWDRLLANSEDVLDKLADEAEEEIRLGKTKPLDPEKL